MNPYADSFPDHRRLGGEPLFADLGAIEAAMGIPQFESNPHGIGLVTLDPAWVGANLVLLELPLIGRRFVNRHIVVPLWDVLATLAESPIADYVKSKECGIYMPRRSNWKEGNPLSFHALGLAIDINWSENKYGRPGTIRQHPGLVKLFERNGFLWGGRFRTPDDMHFVAAAENQFSLPR